MFSPFKYNPNSPIGRTPVKRTHEQLQLRSPRGSPLDLSDAQHQGRDRVAESNDLVCSLQVEDRVGYKDIAHSYLMTCSHVGDREGDASAAVCALHETSFWKGQFLIQKQVSLCELTESWWLQRPALSFLCAPLFCGYSQAI